MPTIPDYQAFRRDQRDEFNAAAFAAAQEGGFVLDVREDDGETVAVIRRQPADRLRDEDSVAYNVRAFLESVGPLVGTCGITAEFCDGYALVQRLVTQSAVEGDRACPELSPRECAAVLRFMTVIQTREGQESYAAGGHAHSGLNNVMHWLSDRVATFGTQS